MPIGYVTANQGESRYTVAIPRKTPLLAALIEARRVEIEGIDRVLEELRKHEAERRETYNAKMADVHLATLMYADCQESYTESACRSARIAAANAAYSDAMDACWDAWRDCRDGCDLGDGDCYDGCDEARESCEAAAERARDNALAAVDRLCVDAVVAHLQACQSEHAPIIAAAQAAAIEALAPLQDAMIAITWERTKRTAAVRRLNELEGIEARSDVRTVWSAQYNAEIPVGDVPAEPTGDEPNAVTVATVSGRAVITEISSVNPCAHDARALPADVLFVDAALAPGVETWRPTWRTGTVTALNGDGTLKVRIDPAILPGTLGTVVSRNNINCTPPGAYFDGAAELNDRLAEARDAYDEAIEARNALLTEIQACRDSYTVESCTAPRNETCETNRDASLLACKDSRDFCLSIAEDANGVQYCLEQYALCVDQVQAIFSACVDGATADCIEEKRQHDSRCQRDRQADLTEAEAAVLSAQRDLINASADIQGPQANLEKDLPVVHCYADRYKVGDDVLIDFPGRIGGAMVAWNSARVVGWASNPRRCDRMVRTAQFEGDHATGVMTLLIFEGTWIQSPLDLIYSTTVPWFRLPDDKSVKPDNVFPFFGVWSESGETFAFFQKPRLDDLCESGTGFGGRVYTLTLPPAPYIGEGLAEGALSLVADYSDGSSCSITEDEDGQSLSAEFEILAGISMSGESVSYETWLGSYAHTASVGVRSTQFVFDGDVVFEEEKTAEGGVETLYHISKTYIPGCGKRSIDGGSTTRTQVGPLLPTYTADMIPAEDGIWYPLGFGMVDDFGAYWLDEPPDRILNFAMHMMQDVQAIGYPVAYFRWYAAYHIKNDGGPFLWRRPNFHRLFQQHWREVWLKNLPGWDANPLRKVVSSGLLLDAHFSGGPPECEIELSRIPSAGPDVDSFLWMEAY